MAEIVASPAALPERLIAEIRQHQSELQRVARVLHEDTGQILTVVGLHLDLLKQDFRDRVPELGERTAEIQQLLEKAIDTVRQLTYTINPDRVQRSGLRYALDMLIGEARESETCGIRFLMDSHVHLPLPVGIAFYKITECALENAVRHSGAQQIEIMIQPAGREVRLEIKDNGKGFCVEDAEKNPRGSGLLWMRHLAREHGLDLRINSRADGPTTVHAGYKMPDNGPVGG
ncbi:MAG: hypothetical protein HY820_11210 [Acidobacteria bacterium]|nr:hypothetical protein [Acidobacteriota bacterium]